MRQRLQTTLARLTAQKAQLASLTQKRETAEREHQTTTAALATGQAIAQAMNAVSETEIARLLNSALSDIFSDQRLEMKLTPTTYRGQPGIDLELINHAAGHGGPPNSTAGGGVNAPIGVILRVIAIMRNPSLTRLLILDESLAAVSASYRPAVAAFLQQMTAPPPQGLGIDILLVTHSEDLHEAADNAYTLENTQAGVTLNRVQTRER